MVEMCCLSFVDRTVCLMIEVFDEFPHEFLLSLEWLMVILQPKQTTIDAMHDCVITREILINSNFNYIPPAQPQFTDVTRPFLQRAPPKKLRARKRVGYARLVLYCAT